MMTLRRITAAEVWHHQRERERERERERGNVNEKEKERNPNRQATGRETERARNIFHVIRLLVF